MGGTAFRNLRRRLRFSPETHDTVKIGVTLHLRGTGSEERVNGRKK